MTKNRFLYISVLIAVFFLSSCSAMCKNPVLKNTKWTANQDMFVADAGTMKIVHTLEFISDKDVKVLQKGEMPPYPAMYVNEDGTIDTMPGHSFEYNYDGTYVFSKGKLTITSKEGAEHEYTLQPDGTLTYEEPWGETLVFTKVKE